MLGRDGTDGAAAMVVATPVKALFLAASNRQANFAQALKVAGQLTCSFW